MKLTFLNWNTEVLHQSATQIFRLSICPQNHLELLKFQRESTLVKSVLSWKLINQKSHKSKSMILPIWKKIRLNWPFRKFDAQYQRSHQVFVDCSSIKWLYSKEASNQIEKSRFSKYLRDKLVRKQNNCHTKSKLVKINQTRVVRHLTKVNLFLRVIQDKMLLILKSLIKIQKIKKFNVN